ncbi:MAG: hypothetical protein ACOYVJ_10500 [Nitrospirota bacterium]
MAYSWDDIRPVVERAECERAEKEVARYQLQEGIIEEKAPLTGRTCGYLEFLGGFSVGLSIGVFTLIFNYLLFVFLLHIEF